MAVLFLSHSSDDISFVRKLADELKKHHVTIWLDERDIRVGDSIPEKLASIISTCDYFCLIISAASIKSDWVQRELNSAMPRIVTKKAKILPVRLNKVELPPLIADIKYADFTENFNSGFESLLRAIDNYDLLTLTPAEVWIRFSHIHPAEYVLRTRPNSPPDIKDYMSHSKADRIAILEMVLPQTFRCMCFGEHTDALLEHDKFFDELLSKENDPNILKLAKYVHDEIEGTMMDYLR